MVGEKGGRDAFVTEGFDTWSKKSTFYKHMGNIDSYHNKAQQKCEMLMRKNQSIGEAFRKRTKLEQSNYEIRLRATIRTCRFLLKDFLPFRGHDESENSLHRGLFIDILSLIREYDEENRKVTMENAPKNEKLTSPKIQKDIVQCFSKEIIKSICDEIGEYVFGLLVDESSDVSKKEQMAIVLRYVDRLGLVKERFIGVVHVFDTSSLTLKAAIDSVFADNNLSMSQVRGQGYDGASNMRGAFNGLKSLILREKHKARVEAAIGIGEIETGTGLNQESSIVRAGDTRWGSHYKTIISLINLFPKVIDVLNYVEEEGSTTSNHNQAKGILSYFNTLDFVLLIHLMLEILGLTDTLSKHLKKKDQDILEAASLVKGTKEALLTLRKDEFPQIWKKVCAFCEKNSIGIVELSEYVVTSRNRRTNMTNQHHFEVVLFNTVLDMQIQEFGDRFSEVSTELLENMVALSHCDSFSRFDKVKLLKLSEMYKNDFDDSERLHLSGQLDIYYHSLLHDDKFANLKGIADLSFVG